MESAVEWFRLRLAENRDACRKGFLTDRELRGRNSADYGAALLRIRNAELPEEERRAELEALREAAGLPPAKKVPENIDVPRFGGLLCVRFPLWPEFPPEDGRLNRDFALPVRESGGTETLFFRLEEKRDSRDAAGTPCAEYLGHGRLPGYEAAEMSLLIPETDGTPSAVILKLYPDIGDPRWNPYFDWCAKNRK